MSQIYDYQSGKLDELHRRGIINHGQWRAGTGFLNDYVLSGRIMPHRRADSTGRRVKGFDFQAFSAGYEMRKRLKQAQFGMHITEVAWKVLVAIVVREEHAKDLAEQYEMTSQEVSKTLYDTLTRLRPVYEDRGVRERRMEDA